MKIRKLKINSRGFTLAEVMIAIFVTLVGVVAVYTLVPRIVRDVAYNNNRFIATQLAAEGVEIVRHVRDGNWLQQRTNGAIIWNDDLITVNCQAGCEADYAFLDVENPVFPVFGGGRVLKIDANGFYNYTAGVNTQFKRKITITPNGADEILVESKVYWQNNSVTVVEKFYNWR